jgi:hypothetical protein
MNSQLMSVPVSGSTVSPVNVAVAPVTLSRAPTVRVAAASPVGTTPDPEPVPAPGLPGAVEPQPGCDALGVTSAQS